ncbi:pyrimidine 5'-nucleotidase [Oceanomicrobium pacificus]|uniref:Pyrimidine 5'-nucleotidase n=1 Tax=Oceanomicrobium pacificus TaxID=2692916 RepID=A0A6B0TXF2_9RHOB|nr:pyrimidine 5'-nucleotidase [Oceanomicrobium pacificus]MXU65972.1 pyrimidine 5'-nucleotidase [Oceanomicrobium pacificus]
MVKENFSHVDVWVFDLDNTLYPAEANLFAQIEVLMAGFVMRELGLDRTEADALRRDYWHNHGTTLAGLMDRHGIDPDPYLHEVHEIDLSGLAKDAKLHAAIAALPGRRIVYTNGSRRHGERVTDALGLNGLFDAIYGIEDADYRPKPEAAAFDRIFVRDGLDPKCGAMFEDDPRNLAVPHARGMRTVLVGDTGDAPHIHHRTERLRDFLTQLG